MIKSEVRWSEVRVWKPLLHFTALALKLTTILSSVGLLITNRCVIAPPLLLHVFPPPVFYTKIEKKEDRFIER
jgi:hypothetical protein